MRLRKITPENHILLGYLRHLNGEMLLLYHREAISKASQ